jgi:hypothetical protein
MLELTRLQKPCAQCARLAELKGVHDVRKKIKARSQVLSLNGFPEREKGVASFPNEKVAAFNFGEDYA